MELLDAGLLELDLPFWRLEEPIESIELLEVILLELLKVLAELELDFAFDELDFPLVELLDRSSIGVEDDDVANGVEDDEVAIVIVDDEVALVEDDDLSFWRLEELIESIELLDVGLLELELEIVVLEDGSFTSVKFTVIVAVADAPDGSVTETLNVQLAFVS